MQRANDARGLRFLPKLAFITTAAVISAAIAYQATAQSVYTDPVGFITLSATNGPNGVSYIGTSMTQVPVFRGAVSAAPSGTAIPLNGLVAGSYTQNVIGSVANNAFFIEDVNSNNSAAYGFVDDIVSNDANNVYTANNDSSVFANGDNIKIVPHWTFNAVFGASNQNIPLTATTSPSTADNIIIYNPVTKGETAYYYRTGKGYRNTSSATIDAGATTLYFDQGIILERIASSDTNANFQLVGGVTIGVTQVPIYTGGNLPSEIYASSVTLTNSGLFTGNTATGFVPSTSPSSADQVQILTGPYAGAYYYRTSKGWRNTTSATVDAGSTPLAIGTSFVINRLSSAGSFTWDEPAPY